MPLPTSDYRRMNVFPNSYRMSQSQSSNATQQIKDCDAATSAATIVGPKLAKDSIHSQMSIEQPVATITTAVTIEAPPARSVTTTAILAPAPYANHHCAYIDPEKLNQTNHKNSVDLASLDSSDTYASCQTHPFMSQGDLIGEMADISCTLAELDMDDMYFATLDADTPMSIGCGPSFRSQVKKSASGDPSLHSMGAAAVAAAAAQMGQSLDMDSGSHTSLDEPPVPKHRKTRFQSSFNKTRALGLLGSIKKAQPENTDDIAMMLLSNTGSIKRVGRTSFMPKKSLASATKMFNQRLFGTNKGIWNLQFPEFTN